MKGERLKRMINRHGETVTLIHDGQRMEVRALICPLLEKERLKSATPLGMVRQEKYVYYGLPENEVQAGDLLEYRNEWFEMQTARAVLADSGLSHRWGILTYCGKRETS